MLHSESASDPPVPSSPLARLRVVLVEPAFGRNVGAIARLMKNYGVKQLVLVNPSPDLWDEEAEPTATHGIELLRAARRVSSFEEATEGARYVLATSARSGNLTRQIVPDLNRPIKRVADELSASATCCIVFGSEANGLPTDVVAQCDACMTLPTFHEYTSLNLSHAVAIVLFLIHQQMEQQSAQRHEPQTPTLNDEAEEADLTQRMFRSLEEALEQVGFLRHDQAGALMPAVRRLIQRAEPTSQEIKILMGLARQLKYVMRMRNE